MIVIVIVIVCKRQGERLEAQWAASAAALLLRPAADARGYNAPLFDAELAECQFAEYPIDTWSKATLAIAPLFSASWEAAASQAASQDFGGTLAGPSMHITQVSQFAHSITPSQPPRADQMLDSDRQSTNPA